MRLGFHTNAFVWAGVTDIVAIARWASEQGFDFLEVGPGIELDRSRFEEAAAFVDLDSFIYCRNFIADDAAVAEGERAELLKRMEFASAIGAKRIIISTGISARRSTLPSGSNDPLKSLEVASVFVEEVLATAKALALEVCIENCPMYRNIATSPLMWRTLFDRIDDEGLKLCYDPSHFVWQMIDVYKPFIEFAQRITHIHVKDTWLDPKKLDDVGILHNTGGERGFEENQWWRHTVIGDGEIDWKYFFALVRTLPAKDIHLSFEMEDYHYEGEEERVKQGLALQIQRIRPLIGR